VGLVQRRWSLRALYVSIGSLVIAILHMVAPFRATLDPDYPGYSFGLIALERGAGRRGRGLLVLGLSWSVKKARAG